MTTLAGIGRSAPPAPSPSPSAPSDFSLDELELAVPKRPTVETKEVDILETEDVASSDLFLSRPPPPATPPPAPWPSPITLKGTGEVPRVPDVVRLAERPPTAPSVDTSDLDFDFPEPQPTPPPVPEPRLSSESRLEGPPLGNDMDDFDLPAPRETGPQAKVEPSGIGPTDSASDDVLDWVTGTSERNSAVQRSGPPPLPATTASAEPRKIAEDLDFLFENVADKEQPPPPASLPPHIAPRVAGTTPREDLIDFGDPAPRLAGEANAPTKAVAIELDDLPIAPPRPRSATPPPLGRTASVGVGFEAERRSTGVRKPWLRLVGLGAGGLLLFGVLVSGVLARFYTEHGFFFWYWITNQPLYERSGARALLDQAQEKAMLDIPDAYKQAITMCDEARRLAPSFRQATAVRAQLRLALIYHYGEDPEQTSLAQADKELLTLFDTEDSAAAYEREKVKALDMLLGSRAREAVGAFENLERQGPKDVWRLTFQGWSLLRSRKAPEAEQLLTRAVTLAPKSDVASHSLALAQLAQEQSDKAKALLETIVERNPAHVLSVLELAILEWKAGDLKGAQTEFESVAKEGAPTLRARAMAMLGKIARSEGQFDLANERFLAALKLDAKNVEALTGLGHMLYEAGRPTDALSNCKLAKTTDPLDLDATLCVVRASIKLTKLLEARIEAEEIVKRSPKQAEAHFLLGQVSEAQEKYAEAIEEYKQTAALDPKLYEPYLRLAHIYAKQQQESLAMSTLAQARVIVGERPEIESALGALHLAAGRTSEAYRAFSSALEKNPQLHEARFQLANLLVAEGRTNEALAQYEKIRSAAKDFPGLSEKLGLFYLGRGEKQRAIDELERALTAEGPTLEVRMAAAEAFVAVGRFEEAQKQADIVGHERPQSAQAHYLLGLTLVELGREADAIAELRQALSLGREGRFLYALGRAYEAAAKEEEALSAYDEAVKLDPSLIDAYVAAAKMRMGTGALRAAMGNLNAARKQAPSRADISLLLGDCASQLGDRAVAAQAYSDAVQHSPASSEARFKLGQELHNAGRVSEAIASLQRAIALVADQPPSVARPTWLAEAYMLLGYAYRDARRSGPAAEAFKKYLEIYPTAPDREDVLRELRYLGEGK